MTGDMKSSGPLGRDSMDVTETMRKYHGEIERIVYAAEVLCPNSAHPNCRFPDGCSFALNSMGKGMLCGIYRMRGWLGEHVKQDDIPTCEERK